MNHKGTKNTKEEHPTNHTNLRESGVDRFVKFMGLLLFFVLFVPFVVHFLIFVIE
jgi:hypothetical protein